MCAWKCRPIQVCGNRISIKNPWFIDINGKECSMFNKNQCIMIKMFNGKCTKQQNNTIHTTHQPTKKNRNCHLTCHKHVHHVRWEYCVPLNYSNSKMASECKKHVINANKSIGQQNDLANIMCDFCHFSFYCFCFFVFCWCELCCQLFINHVREREHFVTFCFFFIFFLLFSH